MKLCRLCLSARNGKGLVETLCNLVKCALAHDHPALRFAFVTFAWPSLTIAFAIL